MLLCYLATFHTRVRRPVASRTRLQISGCQQKAASTHLDTRSTHQHVNGKIREITGQNHAHAMQDTYAKHKPHDMVQCSTPYCTRQCMVKNLKLSRVTSYSAQLIHRNEPMRDSDNTLCATPDTDSLDRKAATVMLDNCQAAVQ